MQLLETYLDDLPALEPVIAHEVTATGWRGLTREGEVFDVQTGAPVRGPPDKLVVARDGKPIGQREVRNDLGISIDEYVARSDHAMALYRSNQLDEALYEYEALCLRAPTTRAYFNRGLVLLSMGRWDEGLPEHELRFALRKPASVAAVESKAIPQWRGENLYDKRLLLVHDAGFGDTIAMLRYVPALELLGAKVTLLMPPELQVLAEQLAPVVSEANIAADYFCPMLSLPRWLNETPSMVPSGTPYLTASDALRDTYLDRNPSSLGGPSRSGRSGIGIAWSVGRPSIDDYKREIPLVLLVAAVRRAYPDCELYSVQMQEAIQARMLGVWTFPFEDFAHCAAFMQTLDRIITVDTAAAHLAGAIGHPDVTLLLSDFASWRWRGNPFYPQFKICQQRAPGDWASALAQL